jgi:hypothetical protein
MARNDFQNNDLTYAYFVPRPVMRKRLSQCSTASVKPRPQSLASERGAIGAHAWQVRARACASASDGEGRYYARSVGKYPRSKMVCVHLVLIQKL